MFIPFVSATLIRLWPHHGCPLKFPLPSQPDRLPQATRVAVFALRVPFVHRLPSFLRSSQNCRFPCRFGHPSQHHQPRHSSGHLASARRSATVLAETLGLGNRLNRSDCRKPLGAPFLPYAYRLFTGCHRSCILCRTLVCRTPITNTRCIEIRKQIKQRIGCSCPSFYHLKIIHHLSLESSSA